MSGRGFSPGSLAVVDSADRPARIRGSRLLPLECAWRRATALVLRFVWRHQQDMHCDAVGFCFRLVRGPRLRTSKDRREPAESAELRRPAARQTGAARPGTGRAATGAHRIGRSDCLIRTEDRAAGAASADCG